MKATYLLAVRWMVGFWFKVIPNYLLFLEVLPQSFRQLPPRKGHCSMLSPMLTSAVTHHNISCTGNPVLAPHSTMATDQKNLKYKMGTSLESVIVDLSIIDVTWLRLPILVVTTIGSLPIIVSSGTSDIIWHSLGGAAVEALNYVQGSLVRFSQRIILLWLRIINFYVFISCSLQCVLYRDTVNICFKNRQWTVDNPSIFSKFFSRFFPFKGNFDDCPIFFMKKQSEVIRLQAM